MIYGVHYVPVYYNSRARKTRPEVYVTDVLVQPTYVD